MHFTILEIAKAWLLIFFIYFPLRSGGGQLVPSALPKKNSRRQQVPEINNEFDFPSLANAVQDV